MGATSQPSHAPHGSDIPVPQENILVYNLFVQSRKNHQSIILLIDVVIVCVVSIPVGLLIDPHQEDSHVSFEYVTPISNHRIIAANP